MKKLLTALTFGALAYANTASAALITSASDPALDGSTLIDFNSQPTTNFQVLTIGDVTFRNLGGGSLRTAPHTEGGVFGGSGQDLSTSSLGSPYIFQVEFSIPVSAFGMVWGAANPDWNVNTYDAGDSLIESLVFPGGNGPASYIEFYGATGPGISRVTLQSAGFSDWVKIDNFEYVAGGAPVPAPGALALLGLGLLGLGLRRKGS